MKPEDWVLALAISNYLVGDMPAVGKPDTVGCHLPILIMLF